jgi:hypothetical protein
MRVYRVLRHRTGEVSKRPTFGSTGHELLAAGIGLGVQASSGPRTALRLDSRLRLPPSSAPSLWWCSGSRCLNGLKRRAGPSCGEGSVQVGRELGSLVLKNEPKLAA